MKGIIFIGAAILTGGVTCALAVNRRRKEKEKEKEQELEIQRELDNLAMNMVSSKTLLEYKNELYKRYEED